MMLRYPQMILGVTTTIIICATSLGSAFAWNCGKSHIHEPRSGSTLLKLTSSDEWLALSIASFSASHIGMSATRNTLIEFAGSQADKLGLVGNDDWRLPDVWPGDAVGQDRIFPDSPTAGRQIYRFFYTMVSFATMGSALGFYLDSVGNSANLDPLLPVDDTWRSFAFAAACFANTAALASLTNASPLGLMPEFTVGGGASSNSLKLQRNDDFKFTVKGLTRITRHPLILPVVPWGISNAIALGARTPDILLFGGLSLYAMLGCYAQDLRVIRQEGTVGTTFQPGPELLTFFENTSFVPFRALFQGKQSLEDILREFPWLSFLIMAPLGFFIEDKLIGWLQSI